jgi:ABC-type polysaccharide/polyol phosphate transport system, ATPase component
MIELINVSKRFKKYTVPFNSFKSFLLNYKKYKEENKKIEELTAVENLSMNIEAGEILCIVGKNGAGKSTLAKMIAGTIAPTKGEVKVNGRIIPFLELGVAFNSELSGYDNAILNGVLLGMKKKYIKEKIDEIFEFAEVQDFIDTPLKFYSSGMLMRLAFSIGVFANGDIYIFDEILAVGDANFQKKCFDSFKNLIEKGKTIILITHDLETVSKYATRVLLLNGKNHKIVNDINIIKQMGKSSFDDIYRSEGLI